MKLSPQWLREFVEIKADNTRLAEDLTLAGIAVETVNEKLDGSGDATVFEMDITTNRPDAMNHYGAAREASVIYDLPLKPLAPKLPAAKPAAPFPIEIEEPELCPRFTSRIIRGVSLRPSSTAMARRLALLDQRPINNIVDASNYVLWEMGKPTHAFDLDLLEGGKIIVRKARAGETLKTLDGQVRQLTPEDLVVADARKPVGLAGVMGGFDTMITEKTRNLLIESAWWDPAIIRKMSRRHGLHTDASHRFERGADYESTVVSCDRVAELILASGGGELEGNATDVIARPMPRPVLTLHLSEVLRHLGKVLSREEVSRILQRLGFELDSADASNEDAQFSVRIPSWRLDVTREIDLIEEIARQHGYNKFANTLPAFSGAVVELPDAAKDARLRSSLLALGYNEAISLTFVSPEKARQFSTAEPLMIANPLSDEASAMRTSLLPGMLDMLGWNLNRGASSVRLFETGRIFEKTLAGRDEKKRVCLGATGSAAAANFHEKPRDYSFFDLKGDLETLFSAFSGNPIYDTKASACFHPGRSARVLLEQKVIAQFGQIHPDINAARKFRQEIFVAEICLDVLYQLQLRQPNYLAPPKFPAVDRDFSFVFADSTKFEQIHTAVAALNIADLRTFLPAETFRGGNIPAGKYSLLLRAVFQSSERTLREEEVAEWSAQIIAALEKLGGTLRV
jgi:phenylalanyl-tRNA synthetase beta chain